MSESASTEETFSAATLEKMAGRIRAILAKAESSEFPEEAATYHQRAEELRRKYQLAEETLIAEDATSITPIVRDIVLTQTTSEFYLDLDHHGLWYWACEHAGILFRSRYRGQDVVTTAVGYASDIRLAEALYQNALLALVSRLEPKVDPRESDLENVYRLRNSGMERNRVAQLLWGSDLGKAGHADHAKVGKLYKMACEERGEDALVSGKGINKKIFREKYGEAFVSRFAERLRRARNAVDSQGGAMVLKGRAERVSEAFWARFPEEHPEARRAAAERYRAMQEEAGAVAKKAPNWTKADQKRWDQRHNSAAAHAGQAAGTAAADRIEIGRTTEPARRVQAGDPERPSDSAKALGN